MLNDNVCKAGQAAMEVEGLLTKVRDRLPADIRKDLEDAINRVQAINSHLASIDAFLVANGMDDL